LAHDVHDAPLISFCALGLSVQSQRSSVSRSGFASKVGNGGGYESENWLRVSTAAAKLEEIKNTGDRGYTSLFETSRIVFFFLLVSEAFKGMFSRRPKRGCD